jgi:hypothetical protein
VRLNGWQRIGVIASVLWFLGAGITVLALGNERAVQRANHSADICYKYPVPGENCADQFESTFRSYRDLAKEEALLAATIPILAGWAFAYVALALTRWVRRGFQKDTIPVYDLKDGKLG